MAGALVEQFSDDFDPEPFTGEYQEQLRTLLDEKLEQGETVDTEATFGEERQEQKEREAEGGKVLSLMDALERSVNKRRGASSGTEEGADEDDSSGGSTKKASSTKSSESKSGAQSGGSKSGGAQKKSDSSSGGSKKSGSSDRKSTSLNTRHV